MRNNEEDVIRGPGVKAENGGPVKGWVPITSKQEGEEGKEKNSQN